MAKNSKSKEIEFRLFAPQAKKVAVAGSFNDWNTKKSTAKKDTKGNWIAKLSLAPGRYEYKFVVDNSWVNDPNCGNTSYNNLGSQNNVVEIR